jgi:hypothetical protein
MGRKLDAYRRELRDATERFVFDGDTHPHDVTIEKIEDAFEAIAAAIDGLPGDPGPPYKLSERVHRVAYEAQKGRG